MVKQWRDPKIQHKPFDRYNPSMKNGVASIYRPWFVIVGILNCLMGIGSIVVAAYMKAKDGDLKDEIFQIWVGLPLLLVGILGIIAGVTRSKKFVVVVMVFALIVMVVAGMGALVGGVRYWMDGWQRASLNLDQGKCSVKANECQCTVGLKMPAIVSDCDDMKTLVDLMIAITALAAGGFVTAVMLVYLSMMSICCGPWMYIEWYDEQSDPDFNDSKVETRGQVGRVNSGFNSNY